MFISLEFCAAFLIFLLIYALLKKHTSAGMMLWTIAFSLLFLWRNTGIGAAVLPAVTIAGWFLSKAISRARKGRKWLLALSIIVVLSPLAFFKYANFGIENMNLLLQKNFPLLDILLPAGLSFYCFQSVAYLMDVYRGKFTQKVSFLEYAFYLTFFPLILCGPITRPGNFFPQIENLKKNTPKELVGAGLFLIISGLLKKGVCADYLAQFVNMVFDNPTSYSGFENLMASLGYTMQIYMDFSGYTDMSIGIASVMGIVLPQNFNYPYRSRNMSEFWGRWHISLSSWFKDYLYIPLGGNRKGMYRTCLNIMVVMLVSGLWHGASWMFIMWGILHGFGQIFYKLSKKWWDKIPSPITILVTFCFASLCWVFFRSPDYEICHQVLGSIFTDMDLAYAVPFFNVRMTWSIMLIVCLVMSFLPQKVFSWMSSLFVRVPWIVKALLLLAALQCVIQFSQGFVAPLIYAQF